MEVLGSGPGLRGSAAGRPRVGFLGRGMSCCLQSILAAASSWACRELMPGRSSLNLVAVPSCCSESLRHGTTLTFCLSMFTGSDLCRLPRHQSGKPIGCQTLSTEGLIGGRRSHPVSGRFTHAAHSDRFRSRPWLPCVLGWAPQKEMMRCRSGGKMIICDRCP